MSTIDWPAGQSQTYVLATAEGVEVQDDHQASGQHAAVHDVATARQLAVSHRAVADALDAAADHLVATRVSATFAVLERLLAGGDMDAIQRAAVNVRGLLDELATGEPYTPLASPEPVTVPALIS